MEYIHNSGFQLAKDGSILAKYGNQFNHIGMAQIQASIEYNNDYKNEFLFSTIKTKFNDNDDIFAGQDIPEYFKLAIVSSVNNIYCNNAYSKGIKFTLIKALVHPINANELAFMYAGEIALAAWYQLQSDLGRVSLTFNELREIFPHFFKSHYDEEM